MADQDTKDALRGTLSGGRPGNRTLGPGDTSDSGSDVPGIADSDSDAQGTGERPSVEPGGEPQAGGDIDTDRVVDPQAAGLAKTPPDPARNGGREE